jgi:hypothetical protein
MSNAPKRPILQWLIRKPSGERQWRRHMVFNGVSCHKPAPTRMLAASHTLVVCSIGDINRADSNAHCNPVAKMLKPPQAIR